MCYPLMHLASPPSSAGPAFPDVASWAGEGVMKINPLLFMCPLSNRERDVGDKRPNIVYKG